MVSFVKMMAEAGCDITEYVKIGTITEAQYEDFTGNDYVAPTA